MAQCESMSIKNSKTKFIHFRPVKYNVLYVSMQSKSIPESVSVNFKSITIDKNIKFEEHIQIFLKKKTQ